MTTTQTTDIRIAAWDLGRRAGNMNTAYRALGAGDPAAVRVFAALSRNEWGVKAAFADGLAGITIDMRDPRTGVTVSLTGSSAPLDTTPRRTVVAANGGTV